MSTQFQQEHEEEQENKPTLGDWIRTTSHKILAIGAGLREFLRFTEKIVFSPEPYREPDHKFVQELTALLREYENRK